eukprot:gene26321-17416_t
MSLTLASSKKGARGGKDAELKDLKILLQEHEKEGQILKAAIAAAEASAAQITFNEVEGEEGTTSIDFPLPITKASISPPSSLDTDERSAWFVLWIFAEIFGTNHIEVKATRCLRR